MTAMVDWVSARVPLRMGGYVNGGSVVFLGPGGEVERSTDRLLVLEGSYAAKLAVKGVGVGEFGELTISGNPAKFLQGHNLFGLADLPWLVTLAMERVAGQLGLSPSMEDRHAWVAGEFHVTRVDVARMYDLGSSDVVRSWLTAARGVAKGRYQAASSYRSESVYVGQRSKRVATKFYDKLEEFKKHPPCGTLAPSWHHALTGYAAGKLRAEVRLGARELADHDLRRGKRWTPAMVNRVLDERLERLELNDTLRLADEQIANLPPKLVPIYDAWRAGRDLRALYSRRTFYRYRRQLLGHGIDIARVLPREVVAEPEYPLGQPLRSFLQGSAVGPPEWARGTDLLVS